MGGFVLRPILVPFVPALVPTPTPVPTPLAKYTLEFLSTASVPPAKLEPMGLMEEEEQPKEYSSLLFSMTFDPTLSKSVEKKVTGFINVPGAEGKFPLVVMIRGYVDQKIYKTGIGSKPAASFFAKNGMITVSLDFLGYAGSDSESGDIFETRFQTYTTLMTLLSTIPTPEFQTLVQNKWDGEHIFIWAHSNGGQVALTVLSVLGETYPTTLWAPVTKPFPYSVLYYTDESADKGVFIRKSLAKFEELYPASSYSFTDYLDRINAPIQLHQGTADDAIPVTWSRDFVKLMKAKKKEITYHEYVGADHNLRPAWNDVVAKDYEYFLKFMRQ